MSKWDKHIAFMGHLINTWEWTEAERRALWKTEPVAYYGSNVGLFQTVKPEQFFEEEQQGVGPGKGKWLPLIEGAMKMVEAEQFKEAAEQTAEQKLRADVDSLQATILALHAKIETLAPAAPVAPAADAPNAAA